LGGADADLHLTHGWRISALAPIKGPPLSFNVMKGPFTAFNVMKGPFMTSGR